MRFPSERQIPYHAVFKDEIKLTYDNFVTTRSGILHDTVCCGDNMRRGNERSSANVIQFSSRFNSQRYLLRPGIWLSINSTYHTCRNWSLAASYGEEGTIITVYDLK